MWVIKKFQREMKNGVIVIWIYYLGELIHREYKQCAIVNVFD